MADFKTIETQEELDSIIKERLARNTKTVTDEVTKKFEGYISPDDLGAKTADLSKQIDTLSAQLKEKDSSIADLTAKNAAYEISSVKTRIAAELGIPITLANRLSGKDEKEIRADAESLAKFITPKAAAPLADIEGNSGKTKDAAYKSLLSGLNED